MASPFARAVVSSMRMLYPEALADKSFDNTGLLLEAPFLPARRNRNAVLLTIDLTRAVAEEAIQDGYSVVVAYHPIIFRGLKAITLHDAQQQSLLRLAAHGVSVYSPHTAVDIVPGGMADWLCDIVTGKLDNPEPETFTADPQTPTSEVEVTTSESVTSSEPTSKPSTKPTTPLADLPDPFDETKQPPKPRPSHKPKRPSISHRTYSKPTYPRPTSNFHSNAIPHSRTIIAPSPASALEAASSSSNSTRYTATTTGAGRLITFDHPQPLTLLITRIAHAIGLPKGFPVAIPQSASVEDIAIRTVGACPGSGASVLSQCTPAPDLVFTGEMSHHDALAVTERGGSVVSLFHSNSERGFLWAVMRAQLGAAVRAEWEKVRTELKGEGGGWGDGIEEILEDENVEVRVSERDRDPFGIVVLVESGVEGVELGG